MKKAEEIFIRNEQESPELLFSTDVFEFDRSIKELRVTQKRFTKRTFN